MQIDAVGDVFANPLQIEAAAAEAEADGYDGMAIPETRHDVFVSLGLAARATTRIALQSGIAVAFARNPMTTAVLANDLQLVTGGRFRLGLGSQVRSHIERRYGMPWSKPAARMEEYVSAIRAIWARFATGEPLRFEGEFYRHTLMTEFFDPGPNPHGNPPILLAAVGERMAEVAGRVADGMLCHSLTTRRYLREVTIPALRRGRGRTLDGFTVSLSALAVLGDDESQRARAADGVRRQIAFYASTPAYRPVLDLHGWGEVHERLNELSRQNAWDEMARLIDDDMLDAFAVAGDAAQVADALRERYGELVQRVSIYTPYPVDPGAARAVADAFTAAA
ncbi:MAG TPA: TIGR03617 family F420-dependent LLM class oxidoreductase [Kribbellaceae bacterium]|jgi:probable F420-dependent oxidoreductase